MKIKRLSLLSSLIILTACATTPFAEPTTANTLLPAPTSTSTQIPIPTATPQPEIITADNLPRIALVGEENFPLNTFTSAPTFYISPEPDADYVFSHFRSYTFIDGELIAILWKETFRSSDLSYPAALSWHAINVSTGVELWSIEFPDATDRTLIWSPDKKRIAYTSGYQMHIIDPQTGEQQTQLQQEIAGVPDLIAWSPDGKYIAVSEAFSSAIHIIESQTGAEALKIPNVDGTIITAMAWSPDGSRFAFGRDNGQVHIFNLTDNLTTELSKEKRSLGSNETIMMHSNDHSVEPQAAFFAWGKGIVSLSFSPDGKNLAFAEVTTNRPGIAFPLGALSVWNLQENRNVFTTEEYDVYGYQPLWLQDQSAIVVFVYKVDAFSIEGVNIEEVNALSIEGSVVYRNAQTGEIIHETTLEKNVNLDYIDLFQSEDGLTLNIMLSRRDYNIAEQSDKQTALLVRQYQIK